MTAAPPVTSDPGNPCLGVGVEASDGAARNGSVIGMIREPRELGMKTMDEAGSGRPGVGGAAPDFTLRRTFEESVHLGTLLGHGPVVLAFYVFDFGPV